MIETSKIEVKHTAHIKEKIWGVDDTYLVVPEMQVMAHEGFKEGDEVEVTIKKARQI